MREQHPLADLFNKLGLGVGLGSSSRRGRGSIGDSRGCRCCCIRRGRGGHCLVSVGLHGDDRDLCVSLPTPHQPNCARPRVENELVLGEGCGVDQGLAGALAAHTLFPPTPTLLTRGRPPQPRVMH